MVKIRECRQEMASNSSRGRSAGQGKVRMNLDNSRPLMEWRIRLRSYRKGQTAAMVSKHRSICINQDIWLQTYKVPKRLQRTLRRYSSSQAVRELQASFTRIVQRLHSKQGLRARMSRCKLLWTPITMAKRCNSKRDREQEAASSTISKPIFVKSKPSGSSYQIQTPSLRARPSSRTLPIIMRAIWRPRWERRTSIFWTQTIKCSSIIRSRPVTCKGRTSTPREWSLSPVDAVQSKGEHTIKTQRRVQTMGSHLRWADSFYLLKIMATRSELRMSDLWKRTWAITSTRRGLMIWPRAHQQSRSTRPRTSTGSESTLEHSLSRRQRQTSRKFQKLAATLLALWTPKSPTTCGNARRTT